MTEKTTLISKYLIGFFILTSPFWSSLTLSEEPRLDSNNPIAKGSWFWRINSSDTEQLILKQKAKNSVEIQFDIAGCMFCEGEEDGCNQDGVFDLSKLLKTAEPLVLLVCHIGAHSRLLEIYAPERNSSEPVFRQTGDYVIDFKVYPKGNTKGIDVSFDRRDEKGEFQQLTKFWALKTSTEESENKN